VTTARTNRKLQDAGVVRRLVMALRAGASRTETLRELGISESTFYRELRRSPELRDLVESEAPGAPGAAVNPQAPAAQVTSASGSGSNGSGLPKRVKPAGSAQSNGNRAGQTARGDVVTPSSPASARRRDGDDARSPGRTAPNRKGRADPGRERSAAPRPQKAEQSAQQASHVDPHPKRRPGRRATPAAPAAPALPPSTSGLDASATVMAPTRPAGGETSVSKPTTALATTAALPGALVAAHAGRPAPSAPAGADWMPPVAVLTLQLVVAIAVGAHPLIILAVALVTLGVLLGVRRARRVVPRRGSRSGIRYREVMVIPEGGPAAPANRPSVPEKGDARSADADGAASDVHRSDLDWVAASILRVPSPDDPRPPRPRS
jgi:hypothetical protein